MKILTTILASACLISLTACDSAAERDRKKALENAADAKEEKAKTEKKAAERAADATEDLSKKRADDEAARIRAEGKANSEALKNQAEAIRDQK